MLLSPNYLIPLDLHPMPGAPQMFTRAFVKLTTSTYFKQRTSNLLRESSEGFSRLIVLLTSSEVLIRHPATEAPEACRARATRVWSQITLIIAHFSLAPPRVLDLILEVASCHLVGHWRFFLALLDLSRWGPPGARGASAAPAPDARDDLDAIKQALIISEEGKDYRAIAEVLAFRFSFYQRPESGDTPIALIFLAALLIKHRFVEFAFLLPRVRRV